MMIIVLMRCEISFSFHSPTHLLTIISILFRNGVGNPVLPPSDVAQTQSMLGTQLSAWSETQCNVNLIELDANDPDGADLLQSPGLTSHTGRSIAKQTRPIAKRNRSLAKHRSQ